MCKRVSAIARCLFAWAATAFLFCPPLNAQVVRDEFTGTAPNADNWFVCDRDESRFRIEEATPTQPRALRTTAHPRAFLAGLAGHNHKECHRGGDPADPFERAEIWEADAIVQPLATEVWYRFSMFIDPDIKPQAKRLVIGQWKQSSADTIGDFSPVLAQRFTGRRFVITIEQDNDQPERDRRDISCRVVIAGEAEKTAISRPQALGRLSETIANPTSYGHDNRDVTHAPKSVMQPATGCARDLEITRFNDLPDPFGRWVTMKFHLRLSTGNGLIEIWANDKPIAKVTGRIGYRTRDTSAEQYFKFGPYRNHEASSVYARIAHYARGFTEEDVR